MKVLFPLGDYENSRAKHGFQLVDIKFSILCKLVRASFLSFISFLCMCARACLILYSGSVL